LGQKGGQKGREGRRSEGSVTRGIEGKAKGEVGKVMPPHTNYWIMNQSLVIHRMFFGFPCPVKTDRSVLPGRD